VKEVLHTELLFFQSHIIFYNFFTVETNIKSYELFYVVIKYGKFICELVILI
jgi:hypothetical protein